MAYLYDLYTILTLKRKLQDNINEINSALILFEVFYLCFYQLCSLLLYIYSEIILQFEAHFLNKVFTNILICNNDTVAEVQVCYSSTLLKRS